MPAVSVIVPVYNVEKYIYRCVDSILSQTFTDFELILVDDGSPDNCPAICDEYAAKDNRIRVIHQKNGGVSRARNAALDVAQGEYIAFCDSDDWWEPQLLERVVLLMKSGNWDWVSVQFQRIYPEGEIVPVPRVGQENRLDSWEKKMKFIVEDFLRGHYGWEVWTKLFRTEIIRTHQIRFCETCGNFAEDMSFCLKYLLCVNAVISMEDTLYNYCLRDNSMMASSANRVKLNELNEVSFDVSCFAQRILPTQTFNKYIGLIHYLIMYNQYSCFFHRPAYESLPKEITKIRRTDWFRKGAFMTIRNCTELCDLYGKYDAGRIVNFSWYCIHRNWPMYVFLRKIINFIDKIIK